MNRHISFACATALFCSIVAAQANPVQATLAHWRALAQQHAQADRGAVAGAQGWFYFVPELRSASAGVFWGEAAKSVSRAPAEYADPLPAILDLKRQLDKAGIALIIAPVPAKCMVYPEYVPNAPALGPTPPRLDPDHQRFYALLRQNGIQVIDLLPAMLKARTGANGPLYCRQDTHWSGQGCRLAAQAIGTVIKPLAWVKSVPKRTYVRTNRTVTIRGDLVDGSDAAGKREQLSLSFVTEKSPSGPPPADWRQSPVLLLGDSHNLIFHTGDDMQAKGAGLADHLAAELGFPVDVVAVRGSGATPARLNLMRRNDNLKGKKAVVWCFSVREFTEGQGWRLVPVIR